MVGLYKYAYGVACACVWAVDKYVGVMRRLVCSRRIASASEVGVGGGWGGRGVLVFHSFAMRLVISSITVICEIRKRS